MEGWSGITYAIYLLPVLDKRCRFTLTQIRVLCFDMLHTPRCEMHKKGA